VLSGGELKNLYSKDFVVFEAEPPSNYLPDEELRKLSSAHYTPVFVFLDSKGKKILETRGFRNPREAKALHEFVSKRAYLKTQWSAFLAAYPKS
jgi:thioredoxin-related protein